MDNETKIVNIRIVEIKMLACETRVLTISDPKDSKKTKINIANLNRTHKDELMFLNVSFDVGSGEEVSSFIIKAEFIAVYEKKKDTLWDDFSTPVAIAHLIPYLREFISNMTSRMLLPPVFIPPVNTFKLFSEYESEKVPQPKA